MLAAAALAAVGAAGAAAPIVLLTHADVSTRRGRTVAAGTTTSSTGAAAPSTSVAAPTAASGKRARSRRNAPGHTIGHRTAPHAARRTHPAKTTAPAKAAAPPATTTIETTSTAAATTHPATTTRRTLRPALSKPVTIADSFGNDYLDPTIWHTTMDGGDVSIAEQDGQLELTVGPGAVPGGTYDQIDVHVGTQCSFPDDFDARVDYKLVEWPAADNIYVGLTAIYAGASVMRQSSSSQSGDGYRSWVATANGNVALPDGSGSLRIARVAGVETSYFWHEGSWRKLASAFSLGAAVLGLQAQSDRDNPFGGQEVKAAFDNFRVTGRNPICAR